MRQDRSTLKRFLLCAAIGVGTTIGLVGLVCICIYAWAAARLGAASVLPFFTALFVPTALQLLLGGIVISIILAAFSFRDPHKTAAAVFVSLLIASVSCCWLVIMTLLRSEWIPAPSPQPYPGVRTSYGFESLTSRGRCASSTYEVARSLPLMRQYYENQMKQYCTGTWEFAATPQSNGTCYEATCDIRAESKQHFTVQICLIDKEKTRVVHKDCIED
jgi:hypothetical protein